MAWMDKLKQAAAKAAEHLPEGGKLGAVAKVVGAISPLAPDWKALWQDQVVVLGEQQINEALAKAVPGEGPVTGVRVAFLGENRLQLWATPKVAQVALAPLSVGLELLACEATPDQARLHFRVVEGLAVARDGGWLTWALAPLMQVLLRQLFKPEWLQSLQPALLQVVGDEVWVDLKAGPLAKAYDQSLAQLLPAGLAQALPANFQLRPIDLLRIRSGAIAAGELRIAFGIHWPHGEAQGEEA